MQKDLDGYLETYNTRRPHRGRWHGGPDALRGLQGSCIPITGNLHHPLPASPRQMRFRRTRR